MISGFGRGINEILVLMGCYVAYTGSVYRRFETMYRPHFLLGLLEANMLSQTSVNSFQSKLRNIPEL